MLRLPDLQDRHGPVTARVNWLLGRGRWELLGKDHPEYGDIYGYGRVNGWWDRLFFWWAYNVRRWPRPPQLEHDRVAHHFGFVDGIDACPPEPNPCAAHGWKPSPLAGGRD